MHLQSGSAEQTGSGTGLLPQSPTSSNRLQILKVPEPSTMAEPAVGQLFKYKSLLEMFHLQTTTLGGMGTANTGSSFIGGLSISTHPLVASFQEPRIPGDMNMSLLYPSDKGQASVDVLGVPARALPAPITSSPDCWCVGSQWLMVSTSCPLRAIVPLEKLCTPRRAQPISDWPLRYR